MKDRRVAFGVVLNVVLLIALAAITLVPDNIRRNSQPARARGEYTMLAGRPNGQASDAIFIVDASNQEVVALKWDSAKKLTILGYRNLETDAKQSPTR